MDKGISRKSRKKYFKNFTIAFQLGLLFLVIFHPNSLAEEIKIAVELSQEKKVTGVGTVFFDFEDSLIRICYVRESVIKADKAFLHLI